MSFDKLDEEEQDIDFFLIVIVIQIWHDIIYILDKWNNDDIEVLFDKYFYNSIQFCCEFVHFKYGCLCFIQILHVLWFSEQISLDISLGLLV